MFWPEVVWSVGKEDFCERHPSMGCLGSVYLCSVATTMLVVGVDPKT